MENVEKQIVELFEKYTGIKNVDTSKDLKTEYGFDSLEKVEVIGDIEREMGFRMTDDEWFDAWTVDDIIKAAKKHLEQ